MDPFQLLALVLGPTGAAYVGVKVALNGTVERVRRIEGKLDTVEKDVSGVKVAVARLQGHNDREDRE
jgi:hypothetical protein